MFYYNCGQNAATNVDNKTQITTI